MPTLYHAPQSRSGRIVWLLEELGADYTLRYTDIVYGDGSGRRDPANIHPDGKVPALDHDGELVTESAAIALYLTDLLHEQALAPGAGADGRAAYVTWLAWNAGELEPALAARMFGGGGGPRADAAFDAAIARILCALDAGPYLMGERFGAADVMIGSTLIWGRAHLPAGTALDAYLDRISERPARGRALAKDAPAFA